MGGATTHTYTYINTNIQIYIRTYIHPKIYTQIRYIVSYKTSKHPYAIRYFWNPSDGVARSHPSPYQLAEQISEVGPAKTSDIIRQQRPKKEIVVSMGFNNSVV